ncbi:hypothetical protein POPTR_004G112600v4 [Populus trichocarpa]|uniref:Uncharacterized protein n=2 Tax=Populus trichocarpa TaxID=3694 RepID=A0A3N7EX94_POPTR|nr:hypothetical protein BDE02_04G099600 [Populus trichocarpa]RQO89222.1 hypothetical protein POPTR_004G112600v4 [Populus trichocarpa]|eukprot:XP_024454981.1 uncharacterized protein LOC18097664 isoform X2 [Populus trichocarpa]
MLPKSPLFLFLKNKHILKRIRNQKMVYKRFLGLALGLLFVMNAIWGSCAYDYHDGEMKKKEIVGFGENTVLSVDKELILSGFSTASTRKMGLGGRKMAVQKESRRETEKEQGLHGQASEDNSGKKNNALDKSLVGSQDQINNQKDMSNLERETLSARLGTPRTDQTVHLPKSNSKDSKALPTKTSLESPSRADIDQEPQGSATDLKSEMQRLLDATREMVNLMNKDYTIKPPKRKPPINNKEPIH